MDIPAKWAYKYYFSPTSHISHLILSNLKGFANVMGKMSHLTSSYFIAPNFQQS